MTDFDTDQLPPYTAHIERIGDRYTARATNPRRPDWTSPHPMTAQELYDALKQMGHHPIDIMDALNACDPEWSVRHPGFRT